MGSNSKTTGQRVTLSGLKEQQYALNMQMLLSIQCHNETAQAKIGEQLEALQEKIDRLCLGCQYHSPFSRQ